MNREPERALPVNPEPRTRMSLSASVGFSACHVTFGCMRNVLEGHLVIDARHVTLNLPILRLKNGRANQISTLKGHSTRPYPMCARTGLNCSGSLPYLAWISAFNR